MPLPAFQLFRSLLQRLLLLLLLLLLLVLQAVNGQLKVGFYSKSCPQAESIVREAVRSRVESNRGVAAGLIRMQFHDCFVQGCDASVLLDSTPANRGERDAGANAHLRGFEVIDSAKAQIESKCPGIVSCADILAFAARDAVVQSGGPSWEVPAGRRDGRVSSAAEATKNLPDPSFTVEQLTASFAAKGLSQDDLITLSGAHTVGVAHCSTFMNRLYDFSSSSDTDPTMNPVLASSLKAQCPRRNSNPNAAVNLDPVTPDEFDNSYYTNLAMGRGLLSSDQTLFTDASTNMNVALNSFFASNWLQKFPDAMIRMSLIEVKTGKQGEIRRNCHKIN